ncbi:MAG: glycosyltransferase [Vicinamibacterales bacterium]
MSEPIRVLELRSVRGTGGGPEKTILLGTARTDRSRFAITICYLRDARDTVFGIDDKAAHLPVDYTELIERHSFDVGIWRQLKELIRLKRIDIVHAHEYKTDLLAWLLWQRGGPIALSTAHGWTGHSGRERHVYYPLDKYLLSRFPKVIAVSSEIRHELIRHGANPDRVVTILNGIDHERFRRDPSRRLPMRHSLGLEDGDIVIGSVGRLEPQKRFDLLIEAVSALRERIPRLKLVIAGAGSLQAELAACVKQCHVEDRCLLLGHRDDVVDLHHAFDLYVQSSDYEGTPNSVLEAMALETPVVATDVGGTAELIRDGVDGLIVPPDNQQALVEGIASLVADRQKAADAATSARRRVETVLSFNTRMASVESVYTELIAGQRSVQSSVKASA